MTADDKEAVREKVKDGMLAIRKRKTSGDKEAARKKSKDGKSAIRKDREIGRVKTGQMGKQAKMKRVIAKKNKKSKSSRFAVFLFVYLFIIFFLMSCCPVERKWKMMQKRQVSWNSVLGKGGQSKRNIGDNRQR